MTTVLGPEPTSRVLVDPSRPDLFEKGSGRPIRVYDWTLAETPVRAPLVMISHGTGGSGRDMGWLARPLAAAHFRVLSLDHHGNNHVDGYHPEGFVLGWERPRDITVALDVVLGEAAASSVGVVGFSIGGYTAAALVGARLDGDVVEAILSGAVPMPPIEEFPDALAKLDREGEDRSPTALASRASADLTDRRVDAAFLIAPGMGGLLTPESLRAITIPVAVRWGDADVTNPFDRDVRPLVDLVPGVDARQVGPGATHHDFVAALTPDRTRARDAVAADAVVFFTEHLGETDVTPK